MILGCASQADKPQSTPADKPHLATLYDSIQGVWWADTSDPSAAFWIDGDTIRDPEHFTDNVIVLRGDSISFKFPDELVTQHVAMRGPDTMMLSGGMYGPDSSIYFKWDSN
jgi:hypothetical protein